MKRTQVLPNCRDTSIMTGWPLSTVVCVCVLVHSDLFLGTEWAHTNNLQALWSSLSCLAVHWVMPLWCRNKHRRDKMRKGVRNKRLEKTYRGPIKDNLLCGGGKVTLLGVYSCIKAHKFNVLTSAWWSIAKTEILCYYDKSYSDWLVSCSESSLTRPICRAPEREPHTLHTMLVFLRIRDKTH